jgi:hypothetical protein
MKSCGGGGTAPHILKLSTRCVCEWWASHLGLFTLREEVPISKPTRLNGKGALDIKCVFVLPYTF